MTTEPLFKVLLPDGKHTKPYSKAKIRAALKAGQISNKSSVEVDGTMVGIRDFCKKSTVQAVHRSKVKTGTGEEILYDASPAMFRNNPVGFILSVVLILAVGLGLAILAVWYLRCKNARLTVTNKTTTLRTGILSKVLNEVRHKDVRNVKLSQSLFQRMLGTGKIEVSSAGQADVEISIAGIPHPGKVKEIIDQYRD